MLAANICRMQITVMSPQNPMICSSVNLIAGDLLPENWTGES
jgi:hypothetical protein